MSEIIDIITYVGQVTGGGYEKLCKALRNHKTISNRCVLVLATPGGDGDAGFRIARALQHTYGEEFHALVPRYCKSAGTLILAGAAKIYLDDMSELGPLDVQIKKGDEVFGRNSGLDLIQAVNYLQSQAMFAFSGYLMELTTDTGLSTKVASEIATKLTSGIFGPIAAQIDPMKLAEMQRATEIAMQYASRLALRSKNLKPRAIGKLVTSYPSHGFVIDRKEAKALFVNVERPPAVLLNFGRTWNKAVWPEVNSGTPKVEIKTVDLSTLQEQPESHDDQHAPDAGDGEGSIAASLPHSNGDVTGAKQGSRGKPVRKSARAVPQSGPARKKGTGRTQ